MAEEQRGWVLVPGNRKAHFYDFAINTRALCNGHLFFSKNIPLENHNHNSVDNCAACKKKRAKAYPNDVDPEK